MRTLGLSLILALGFSLACSSSGNDEHGDGDASENPNGPSGGSFSLGTGGDGFVGSGGTGGTLVDIDPTQYAGDVTLSDAQVDFKHASYSMNENGSLASQDNGNVVTTTFDVHVIENDLVKVTVLPEFGGRILSMIYKPTNHEMLYQNSVGVPFGAGGGNFYYDWLMVYGGIFPTFPEPEHGKTWFLPWSYDVVKNTGDEVAISMSFTDDIEPEGGVPPERFVYGRTDLTVTATVRIRRGSSAVLLDLSVKNNKSTSIPYEYWTCTTLTPGSTPGDTRSPKNSEIIAPIDEVYSTYGWVYGVEENVGENVFTYDKLAHFSEWDDMGILYAHPEMDQDYWGVINHDNDVGIFRIADSSVTPGLKFWTWGADSADTNLAEPNDRRPYIELWAGHSQQFFWPAQIDAQETISWTETYIPTIGLSGVDFVNENAAAQLEVTSEGEQVSFRATVFTALPSIATQVTLFKNDDEVLHEQDWTPDAGAPQSFTVGVSASTLAAGDDLGVLLETANGVELYRATIDYAP